MPLGEAQVAYPRQENAAAYVVTHIRCVSIRSLVRRCLPFVVRADYSRSPSQASQLHKHPIYAPSSTCFIKVILTLNNRAKRNSRRYISITMRYTSLLLTVCSVLFSLSLAAPTPDVEPRWFVSCDCSRGRLRLTLIGTVARKMVAARKMASM